MKKRLEEEEMEGCTFKPKTNKPKKSKGGKRRNRSRRASKASPRGSSSIYDRGIVWNSSRNKRNQKLAERLKDEEDLTLINNNFEARPLPRLYGDPSKIKVSDLLK